MLVTSHCTAHEISAGARPAKTTWQNMSSEVRGHAPPDFNFYLLGAISCSSSGVVFGGSKAS